MQDYAELEVDFYPDKDSEGTVAHFLKGLRHIAEAQNKSSDNAVEGGAGFSWKIKITAEGVWA